MHRAVPVISKIVDRKWHERQHSRHQVRLRHMKPVTTVDPPAKPRFLETRAKKRQMQEGKNPFFLTLPI